MLATPRRLAAGLAALLAIGAGGAVSPPASPFAFTVLVQLSPKAAVRLAALREGVIVSASFYGEPTAAAQRHADEVGQIDLAREEVALPATAGRAAISGKAVETSRLAWLKGGAVEVNVNVYSARLSGPDNILACDFFQDSIAAARRGPVKLACKLISEG